MGREKHLPATNCVGNGWGKELTQGRVPGRNALLLEGDGSGGRRKYLELMYIYHAFFIRQKIAQMTQGANIMHQYKQRAERRRHQETEEKRKRSVRRHGRRSCIWHMETVNREIRHWPTAEEAAPGGGACMPAFVGVISSSVWYKSLISQSLPL